MATCLQQDWRQGRAFLTCRPSSAPAPHAFPALLQVSSAAPRPCPEMDDLFAQALQDLGVDLSM